MDVVLSSRGHRLEVADLLRGLDGSKAFRMHCSME